MLAIPQTVGADIITVGGGGSGGAWLVEGVQDGRGAGLVRVSCCGGWGIDQGGQGGSSIGGCGCLLLAKKTSSSMKVKAGCWGTSGVSLFGLGVPKSSRAIGGSVM